MVYFQKKKIREAKEHSKLDYYLAQIAREVRAIGQSFAKSPKPVSTEECLIKFDIADDMGVPDASGEVKQSTRGRKDLEEAGPEVLEDPKWARVNSNAKAVWAARFGLRNIEEAK